MDCKASFAGPNAENTATTMEWKGLVNHSQCTSPQGSTEHGYVVTYMPWEHSLVIQLKSDKPL